MPAFLIQVPDGGRQLIGGADSMVVFATNETEAREAAAAHFDGDGNQLWLTVASATQLANASNLSGLSCFCTISGGSVSSNILARGLGEHQSISAGVPNAGGASYVVDDIVTVAGGDAVRPATLRVITVSTGSITAVEVVDPGEYRTLPPLTANAVTGGTGNSATIDLTAVAAGSYESALASVVRALNADPQIAGASLDMSEGASGARLLTLSDAGDGIGDATVVFQVRQNGQPLSALVSTITDGGAAGAALTVAVPASPVPFPSVTALKS